MGTKFQPGDRVRVTTPCRTYVGTPGRIESADPADPDQYWVRLPGHPAFGHRTLPMHAKWLTGWAPS